MSKVNPHGQNRTDPRPRTIYLGQDSEGAQHYWRTRTETVHVVEADGTRSHVIDIWNRPVEAYMEFVDEESNREWDSRHYGVGFVELLRQDGLI